MMILGAPYDGFIESLIDETPLRRLPLLSLTAVGTALLLCAWQQLTVCCSPFLDAGCLPLLILMIRMVWGLVIPVLSRVWARSGRSMCVVRTWVYMG
jgi:hypothetical protein